MIQKVVDAILSRKHARIDDCIPDRDARLTLVRQYGDFTVAYRTAVTPLFNCFGDERGYITYAQKMGYTFALGDPICSQERRKSLIKEFISSFNKPIFSPVCSKTATELSELGYFATQFGTETNLPLCDPGYQYQLGKQFRKARRWLESRGYWVAEDTKRLVNPRQIALISTQFKNRRIVDREMTFMNRTLIPVSIGDEVRRFFVFDPDGQPVSFVFFDPLYRDGSIVGYAANINRRGTNAPRYSQAAIMRTAISTFSSEGCECLKLGLSPLIADQSNGPRADAGMQFAVRQLYHSNLINRRIINLKGIANYKKGFKGQAEPMYFAAPRRLPLIALIALARACRMI